MKREVMGLCLIRPAADERTSGAINPVKYRLSLFISLFFLLRASGLTSYNRRREPHRGDETASPPSYQKYPTIYF